MLTLTAAVLCLSLHSSAPVRSGAHPYPSNLLQIAESWDDLSSSQRDRALRNYQRYLELPPEKKRDIDKRYEKWKTLPRDDRERFRRKHDEYRRHNLVED